VSSDLPGFDFSRHRPEAEVLHADPPRPVSITEAAKLLAGAKAFTVPRSFEITMEGAVKVTGYSPDEVDQLLKNYREHVVTFSRQMQELQAAQPSADAVRYSPVGPEDIPETFGDRRNR
jgi:hypothetical protein